MRWHTGMERRRSGAVVVWAETTWLTQSARKVLVNVGLDVTGEVSQQDATVTDVLSAGRLLLLMMMMMRMMMMMMTVMVMLIVIQ